MNSPLRSALITLTLAFAMAAGAVVHGMALAAPPRHLSGLHEIVICAAGSAETVITLDAQGNRVDPAGEDCAPLPCPDCLSTVAFALPPAQTAHARHEAGSDAQLPPRSLNHIQRRFTPQAARGPPHKV